MLAEDSREMILRWLLSPTVPCVLSVMGEGGHSACSQDAHELTK